MVWLAFNPYAYDLQSAVNIIRRGLDAAQRALQEDEDRVAKEMAENERAIAAGEASGAVVSPAGEVYYDPAEIFAYEFETIEETVMEVRKSMMIALYHAWERVARQMTDKNSSDDNHKTLHEALQSHGVETTVELDHLRKLVNLIKHNSKPKMLQLWKVRKDLFLDGFDPDNHSLNDWSGTLRINPNQIEEFFEAAIASGPKHPPKRG